MNGPRLSRILLMTAADPLIDLEYLWIKEQTEGEKREGAARRSLPSGSCE
jgi:hypothetical protein